MNFDMGSMGWLGMLAVAWMLFCAIFWMVVGWRAMRAHEKLARNSDEMIEALRAWWRERRRRDD